MSREIKSQMQTLLSENKKKEYLILCKDNYSATVAAAQELFPNHYSEMLKRLNSSEDPWTKYNSKAQEAKRENNTQLEIEILESAVGNDVDTPGTYERLAILYSKQGDYRKAFDVCKKWFSSEHWMIPNAATTSLKLLDRLEKLEKKM